MDFRNQLEQVQGGLVNAQQIIIDLSIAAIDKPYNIAGNYCYVKEAPDQTSYISIKVNETNQPAINWVKQTGFLQPFTKLYITTPSGQAGDMTILIASMAPDFYTVIDNRSAVSESMNDVLGELRGDTTFENIGNEISVDSTAVVQVLVANSSRKGCMVQAKITNSSNVYIGFDNSVTSGRWVAQLAAGMSFTIDDYRGNVWVRADVVSAQLVGWGEW